MSDATTVLLIDDDPHYREYYAQRLHTSSSNYDVVEARTGRSGLDICARQPIECVVLELDLPDMFGFEVLAKLVPRVYHLESPGGVDADSASGTVGDSQPTVRQPYCSKNGVSSM